MSSRTKYLVGGKIMFSRFSSLKQSVQRFCLNVQVITIREIFKKLVDMWVLDLIVVSQVRK
jgi:hypothetical protein